MALRNVTAPSCWASLEALRWSFRSIFTGIVLPHSNTNEAAQVRTLPPTTECHNRVQRSSLSLSTQPILIKIQQGLKTFSKIAEFVRAFKIYS